MGAGMTTEQAAEGAAPPTPARLAAPAPRLLARNAEDLLWLARYVERVENLARLLDVAQTFTPDGGDGGSWRTVLAINADAQRFFETHREANARSVAQFYLLDGGNPTSIPAAIARARENARTLRALLPTEMWLQINVFHSQIRAFTEAEVAPENLSRICAMLREGCQAHTGITEGTLYRDQGHSFYAIGRHLERADQTTRLLDIGYRTLRPLMESGAGIETVRWTALLRSAAGYHAYRRVHPAGFSVAEVVGFLLLDESFPRSVGLALHQVGRHLLRLRDLHGLPAAAPCFEAAEGLRAALAGEPVEDRLRGDLPGFLDRTQQQIGALHDRIAAAFFPA
jgi:uncharacterized alpha-E superfamily protein